MEEMQQLRERLVAVETTLGHLARSLEELRQGLRTEREARETMLQEREPYKKLIWGAVGAIGLFLVLERLKIFDKLLRP